MVGLLADKRVSKGKHHGDTDTDKESSVDKTGQKEHLGLQCVDKLRLASRSFEVFATHDSDTDTGTEGTKANDQAASQCKRKKRISVLRETDQCRRESTSS